MVDIAEHEAAAMQEQDHRSEAGDDVVLRHVDAGADLVGGAGDQAHLHADAHIVDLVAQDAAQRHVERRERPRLRRAALFDALAAHRLQHVEDVAHIGVEPLHRRGIRCMEIAVLGETPHLNR